MVSSNIARSTIDYAVYDNWICLEWIRCQLNVVTKDNNICIKQSENHIKLYKAFREWMHVAQTVVSDAVLNFFASP